MIWYKNIFKKSQRLFSILLIFSLQLEIEDISVTLHKNVMKAGFVLFISFLSQKLEKNIFVSFRK